MKSRKEWLDGFIPALYILASTQAVGQDVDVHQDLVENVDLKPFVAVPNQQDMILEIQVTDPTIASIEILNGFCFQATGQLEGLSEQNSIVLRDDGLQGDRTANDQIFTAQGLNTEPISLALPVEEVESLWRSGGFAEKWNRTREQEIIFTRDDGSALETTVHANHPCGVINRQFIDLPEITKLDADAQMSCNVLNIVLPENSAFPYYNQEGPRFFQQELSQKVLSYVKDVYDWIIIQELSGRGQQYWTLSRPESGISALASGPSTGFGSDGRLRGFIYGHGRWARRARNLQISEKGVFGTLNHEILHAWAAFLPESLDLNSNNGHWQFIQREL